VWSRPTSDFSAGCRRWAPGLPEVDMRLPLLTFALPRHSNEGHGFPERLDVAIFGA